uniref:Putative microcephalin n=1 Tax=Culex tarsalis TaxID=7177 RepID=A0A1Q3EZX6_CULTA
MNRVMRSYTPDLKASGTTPSRMSTIGAAATTTPIGSGSAARRRFSVSSVVGASATMVTPPARSFSQDAGTPTANKRMSLHENLMLKILATPVDHALNDGAANSSGDESFCSSLGRSFSIEQLLESDDQLRCTTPTNGLDIQNNPRLARLYKDLHSPSATTRIRALRALKSPSKRDAYGQFDVPHEEQDIITEEERRTPTEKTIQQVMAGVCVYIEVRSGADNRSDGIKDVVASLGAKVNDKLYKDTTHVIFKDGLMSTYQKAKKMNIPVVSILWIEACKRHLCIMNPANFAISNQERYENPDLFKKIRRQKSMQPRAEELNTASGGKKRPTATGSEGAGGGSSSSAGARKSAISPPAKLPVLHRIRKDDGLERILNEFQNDNAMTQEPLDDFDKMLAGPMRLLERFRNSPVTGSGGGAPQAGKKKEDKVVTPEPAPRSIRKSLMFNGSAEKVTPGRRRSTSKEVTPVVKTTPAARQRRKTVLFTPRVTSVEEEEVESPAVVPVAKTRTRRKTLAVSMDENSPVKRQDTIRSPKAMELSKQNSENQPQKQQENVPPARSSIYSPSKMEQSSDKTDKVVRIEMGPSPRRTLGPKTSENVVQSNSLKKAITPELDAKDMEAFRTNRRRTLYTPGVYDESDKQTLAKETPVLNRRSTFFNPPANSTATEKTPGLGATNKRSAFNVPETPEEPSRSARRHTIFTPNPPVEPPPKPKTLLEEYQSSLTFSSTRTPISERRKTIFDISMDIIDKRLSQINQQSKISAATPQPTNRAEAAAAALKSPTPRPSSVSRQTSLESFYRKASKSTEKSIKFKSSADLPTSSTDSDVTSTVVAPRKRKLFNAPSSASTDSSQCSALALPTEEDNPSKRAKTPPLQPTSSQVIKTPAPSRRRSMAVAKAATAVKTTRRSSFLFEPATQRAARPVMGTQARTTMKALGIGAGLPTASSQASSQHSGSSAGQAAVQFRLATTNLHADQQRFVKEVRQS